MAFQIGVADTVHSTEDALQANWWLKNVWKEKGIKENVTIIFKCRVRFTQETMSGYID